MLQIPAYQKQPGFFGNPSHGSGWMVQVQPFPADFRFLQAGSEQSTHFPWVGFKNSVTAVCRPDLNHPPAPVGGIP